VVTIKSLRLQNFQAHKDNTIVFDDYFNCVIGATRSGKSSMVRALNFLIYNVWHSSYVRHGCTEVVITATLSNGFTIIRIKGDKINQIDVRDSQGKVKTYDSFGTNLPKEVCEVLGIHPLQIDEDEFITSNVVDQDEPMFLLKESGPTKTKILARLAGLHWIDFALKDLNKDRRRLSSETDSVKSSNFELNQKLSKLPDLTEARTKIVQVRTRYESLRELDTYYNTGLALKGDIVSWKKQYFEFKKLKDLNFNNLIKHATTAQDLYQGYHKLKDLSYRLENISDSTKNLASVRITIQRDRIELEHLLEEARIAAPICPTCKREL